MRLALREESPLRLPLEVLGAVAQSRERSLLASHGPASRSNERFLKGMQSASCGVVDLP